MEWRLLKRVENLSLGPQGSWPLVWQNHLNYPGSSALANIIRQYRLKRTWNGTILGLSGNVQIQPPVLGSNKHTPHEGESRDITTTILQRRHSNDYKPVKNYYYKANLSKTVIQAITLTSEFESSGKRQRRLQHVPKVYQASPSMVSLVIVIAGRRRIPLYGPARRQWARIG